MDHTCTRAQMLGWEPEERKLSASGVVGFLGELPHGWGGACGTSLLPLAYAGPALLTGSLLQILGELSAPPRGGPNVNVLAFSIG